LDTRYPSACECTTSLCDCVISLGLRGESCSTLLWLTGDYGGRPVECPASGCWPLLAGSRYSVCGTVVSSDVLVNGPPALLSLDSFCMR